MCYTGISSITPGKVYTQKEILILENLISEFHDKYYTPAIQKLGFHFPHVIILGTHNCSKERRETLKRMIKQHDILCQSDYAERILSSFDHQIQSEYSDGNRSVSIEGIALENFGDSNQSSSSLISEAVSR